MWHTQINQESTVPAMHSPALTASLTAGTFWSSHFSFTDEKYVDNGSPLVCVTAFTHCGLLILVSSSTMLAVLTSNHTEIYQD